MDRKIAPIRKFAFLLLFIVAPTIGAVEPYDLIDALLPKGQMPRLLNSNDVDLNPDDPEPLFAPTGDFDKDGNDDMAVSGIYGLPTGKHRYFLLVGSELKQPIRYEKLFFEEFDQPVFLHKPGTTGEKDPGDQAFAITFCSQCSDGVDFYWDTGRKSFRQQPWVRKVRRYREVPHIPETDIVTPEVADAALKIVGDLPDVKVYVAGLKKAGKVLGTRVRPVGAPNVIPAQRVAVEVFEKKGSNEHLYDRITVDVASKQVVRRNLKTRGK